MAEKYRKRLLALNVGRQSADGIRVLDVYFKIDPISWTVAYGFLAWVSVMIAQAKNIVPDFNSPQLLLVVPIAFLLTIILFILITIHVLTHVYIAKLLHIKISHAVLCFLGSTLTTEKNKSYWSEIIVRISGPLASIFISIPFFFFESNLSKFIATCSFTIGAINLLPIYPFDAGYILKNLLLHFKLSHRKSSKIMAVLGFVVASLIAIAGVVVSIFKSEFMAVLVFSMICFLIIVRQNYRLFFKGYYKNKKAKDVMVNTEEWVTVSEDATIEDFSIVFFANGLHGYPVVDRSNKVVGLVTYWYVKNNLITMKITKKELIKEVMKKVGNKDVCAIQEDTPVSDIVDLMMDRKVERLMVFSGENCVGIVSKSKLIKYM